MAHRFSLTKAAALVGGLSIALGAGPAFAYDDGYENVFSSVLTAVGLISPEKTPDIDYRERPQLVLPPKTALVKPQAAADPANPAWPQDPDVVRRRKEATESKFRIGTMFSKDGVERMSKAEQLKYRAIETPRDPYACNMNEHGLNHCRVDPDELKAESDRFRATNPEQSDKIEAGVEPDRQYLTQPPKGYMAPTKTVMATHEAPVDKADSSRSMYAHDANKKAVDPLDN